MNYLQNHRYRSGVLAGIVALAIGLPIALLNENPQGGKRFSPREIDPRLP